MYTSNYEVIENLINVVGHNMSGSFGSPEEWLESKLEDNGVTPWQAFAEEHSLDEWDCFEDLESEWEDFKDNFNETAWDRPEIESAVEEEVEEVWENMTGYASAEDKYEMILRLA